MKPLAIATLTLGSLGTTFAALLSLPPSAPAPPDNPTTPEKVALGRQLFFDPILSRDQVISCSSCHSPQHAFADPTGQAISPGTSARRGRRNAISLINAGDRPHLTWPGTASSLETQAMIPMTDHAELDLSVDEVVTRLKAAPAYVKLFQTAFNSAPTMQNTVRALGSFERTLESRNSPYDRYQAGDASALSAQQVRGLDLFFGKADCFHCHTGRDFSDERPHNNAILLFNLDTGRAEQTEQDGDVGKFITPSLRNVGLTAPYMHDGSFKTLKQVVEHYNDGGEPNPNADPLIRPLGLSEQDIDDLVAFLTSLDDPTIKSNPAFAAPLETP
ncbi:cytochrome-c peroxidase [Deinococcus rubellus]|uniref:cytochrome-c peroxidase n=1 Tax=Deinococcus rubellus TaxID=1889240 RepID=UPI0031EDC34C